ncbi:MAG: hypothetical protein HKN13_05030 [Rhodothermales bacterium]|nr:hypothetical protein [Rhodothermales bacterium]
MIEIAVPLVLGIISLTLLVMLIFGVRSLSHGRISPMTAGAIAIPLVLLAILGFVTGDWPRAGVLTILITLVGTLLSMAASSIKGLFS